MKSAWPRNPHHRHTYFHCRVSVVAGCVSWTSSTIQSTPCQVGEAAQETVWWLRMGKQSDTDFRSFLNFQPRLLTCMLKSATIFVDKATHRTMHTTVNVVKNFFIVHWETRGLAEWFTDNPDPWTLRWAVYLMGVKPSKRPWYSLSKSKVFELRLRIPRLMESVREPAMLLSCGQNSSTFLKSAPSVYFRILYITKEDERHYKRKVKSSCES